MSGRVGVWKDAALDEHCALCAVVIPAFTPFVRTWAYAGDRTTAARNECRRCLDPAFPLRAPLAVGPAAPAAMAARVAALRRSS